VWCDLPREQVATLDRTKVVTSYRPGEVIYHQGTACVGLHCVESGTVALRRVDRQGARTIERLVHGGETLSLNALFGGGTHTTAAEALTPTRVCFVERASVLEAVNEAPALSLRLLRRLSEELRSIADERLRAVTRSVRERVARLLVELVDRFGAEGPDGALSLTLPLARQDMAALLGVRAESIARAVRALEVDGVARFSGRQVTIPSLDPLLAELPEGE